MEFYAALPILVEIHLLTQNYATNTIKKQGIKQYIKHKPTFVTIFYLYP